jgi:hypothetical protein
MDQQKSGTPFQRALLLHTACPSLASKAPPLASHIIAPTLAALLIFFYASIPTSQPKCICMSLATHCLLLNKCLFDRRKKMILILILGKAKFKCPS